MLPAPPQPSAELIAALREHASSNLSDCMGRAHTAESDLRPMHRTGALCGPALTVRTARGDNLMVHKAVDIARPGDVIVVDAGGFLEVAIIGDIMTTLAAKRGVAGFVIDGAIRDSAEIATRDLPVYACGVTSRGPSKDGPGEINGPVNIGGMLVNPGDIIVGDADGVVAVPIADANTVLERVRALREKERELLRKIADGTIDRSWVDATLKSKGCAL
jgi:RraA family protein